MSQRTFSTFWREATAWGGSVTPYVMRHVIFFGLVAVLSVLTERFVRQQYGGTVTIDVGLHEIAGCVLGLLLVLRTNAGYDRWWEARKLWGGIVNQSRNFAITALSYGPDDDAWRAQLVRWTAAFAYAACANLRSERPGPRLEALLGVDEAKRLGDAGHMPSYVALRLSQLLREARNARQLDDFSFVQADRERALLIDHIGGCERILKTPLPRVYTIKIRRFIVLFLLTLPFALLQKVHADWLVPVVTMLAAYPLISLDVIGIELQNPFCATNLGHLPLDEIAASIERNVTGLLKAVDSADD